MSSSQEQSRSPRLLIAPETEDADAPFARAVVLIVDAEPNGITTGVVLNRPLPQRAIEVSALAPFFLPDAQAPAFWGGPMGKDPLILAELSSTDGLEWFHLGVRQRRPFPLPNVGVVALGEHADAFGDRIQRARLFVGMCVWRAGQLEAELAAGGWLLVAMDPEAPFTDDPEGLWERLRSG